MRPGAKLAGFALVLLAAFGAGYGTGTAVGPLADAGAEQVEEQVDERQHDMPAEEMTR